MLPLPDAAAPAPSPAGLHAAAAAGPLSLLPDQPQTARCPALCVRQASPMGSRAPHHPPPPHGLSMTKLSPSFLKMCVVWSVTFVSLSCAITRRQRGQ